MDAAYIQNLRYKLQRRVRRLSSTRYQLFHFGLQQFWSFLVTHPFLQGLLSILEPQAERVGANVEDLFTNGKMISFSTEEDHLLASYLVLRRCAESDNSRIEIDIAQHYSHEKKFDDSLEAFRDVFVEPLYDYLDEAIDERGAMLATLRRYKQRCEWFRREHLFQVWSSDKQRGEKLLALDLYEYMFDQGMTFQIEPVSASGEADLVSSQVGREPLIADAKIFNAERGKTHIARAFRQIYTYTLDYNETFGFLVVFNTGDQSIHFCLPEAAGMAPFLVLNHKTIFFVVIDIFPHPKSASQRPPLRSVEISQQDLLTVLNDETAES